MFQIFQITLCLFRQLIPKFLSFIKRHWLWNVNLIHKTGSIRPIRIYQSSDVVGTLLYGMGNPDLKWQTTDSWNVGLDFTLFNNRLSGRFEYYYKLTENTVLDYSLAPSIGFNTIKDNVGNISNSRSEVGRKRLLAFIYVEPDDVAYLRKLMERGIELEIRAVPADRPIDVDELLRKNSL